MRGNPVMAARNLTLAALVCAALGVAGTAHAQQSSTFDNLLEKLKDKGVLSEDEYNALKSARDEEIQQQRADRRQRALKEAQATEAQEKAAEKAAAATKLDISPVVRSMQFYGDVRTRYETRAGDNGAGTNQSLDRYRYAVRLGVKGDLTEKWYYGLRLETSSSPRSTWITFGGDTNNGSPSNKSQDTVNVGQAYFGWRPTDWIDLTLGRMPNPFFTAGVLVWDPDINPEGAAEKLSFAVNDRLTVFGNFGQFLYQDNSPAASSSSNANLNFESQDQYLIGWQAGASYKFTPDTSIKAALSYYQYNGNPGTGTLKGPFYLAGNNTGINDLGIVDVPVELKTKLGDYALTFYADYATNTKGSDRAKAAGQGQYDDQVNAYMLGVGLGSLKKKGDWETRLYWQKTEAFALDTNLVDSDLFDGRTNIEGWYASAAYNFTDAIFTLIRYGTAKPVNDNLRTPGAGDLSLTNLNSFNLLQMDVGMRF